MKSINQVLLLILLFCLMSNPISNTSLKLNKNKVSKKVVNFGSLSKEINIDLDKKLIFSSWIKYFKLSSKNLENIFLKNAKDNSSIKSKILENFFVNPMFKKKLRDNYSKTTHESNNFNDGLKDKNNFKMILFNDAIHFITDEKVISFCSNFKKLRIVFEILLKLWNYRR